MADAGPVRDQALGILATAASGPVVETSLEVQTGQAGPVVESDLSIVTDGYYVYDVIVMKGAYNPEVARWMQMQRAWLPASVSTENVLALYDPNADKLYDFGGMQLLADSGMHQVTYALTSTNLRYAKFRSNSYLSGSPFGTSLGTIGEFTVYSVGASESDAFYTFSISAPLFSGAANAGSISSYLRLTTQRSAALIHDETNNAKSDADNTLAANTVAQLTTRFSTTEVESWRDGLQSSGAVAHSLDPGSAVAFDQLDIGGLHNATGDDAGKLLYMLVVQGGRNATVEAELAARFPIGEVLP